MVLVQLKNCNKEYIMKLSNETLTVLKNFAGINSGIEFKTGNKIATISSTVEFQTIRLKYSFHSF